MALKTFFLTLTNRPRARLQSCAGILFLEGQRAALISRREDLIFSSHHLVDVFFELSVRFLRHHFEALLDVLFGSVILFKAFWYPVDWDVSSRVLVVGVLDGTQYLTSVLAHIQVVIFIPDVNHERIVSR